MPLLSGTSVASLIIRITLRQSNSVRIYSANVLVAVAFSAFPICGLRLLMKPVLLPTCVHLEFMAFSSRSTVPLLITNIAAVKAFPTGSNVLFVITQAEYNESSYRCRCILIEFAVVAFHCGHSGSFNVSVRYCEDESCILNDRYRITYGFSLSRRASLCHYNCQRSINSVAHRPVSMVWNIYDMFLNTRNIRKIA
ncbi:hypothetical protein T07_4819 [Trichinella nelsoni]|uniref:Uncharacterized protein n=1 Tax=Trichinella nelsoni TaxID=6336 RepID=A0A0V0S0D5_9BILA|nr:hypothetical protein T07_4819 [Trichinella nelsoni]